MKKESNTDWVTTDRHGVGDWDGQDASRLYVDEESDQWMLWLDPMERNTFRYVLAKRRCMCVCCPWEGVQNSSQICCRERENTRKSAAMSTESPLDLQTATKPKPFAFFGKHATKFWLMWTKVLTQPKRELCRKFTQPILQEVKEKCDDVTVDKNLEINECRDLNLVRIVCWEFLWFSWCWTPRKFEWNRAHEALWSMSTLENDWRSRVTIEKKT